MEKWTKPGNCARKGVSVILAVMLVLTTTGVTAAAQEVNDDRVFDAFSDVASPASEAEPESAEPNVPEAEPAEPAQPAEPETPAPETESEAPKCPEAPAPDGEPVSTEPVGAAPETEPKGAAPEAGPAAEGADPESAEGAPAAAAAFGANPAMEAATEAVAEAEEQSAVEAQSAEPTSGTIDECKWEISGDGTLTISPDTGNEIYFPNSALGEKPLDIPWKGRSDIKSVVVSEKVVVSGSPVGLFAGLRNCQSMDLSGLDTSRVHSVESMFENCSSLTSLKLGGLGGWNVNYAQRLFAGCSSLVELDLSGFVVANTYYLDVSEMFAGCSSLVELDLSNFSGFENRYIEDFFEGCESLITVKVGEGFLFKSEPDDGNLSRSIARELTGEIEYAYLPAGEWYSEKTSTFFTPEKIAEDRNGLADTYRKVSQVSHLEISGVAVPVAGNAIEPVQGTLAIQGEGVLSKDTFVATWRPEASAASDGSDNDIFQEGATYVLPVEIALGSHTIRGADTKATASGFEVRTPEPNTGTTTGPAGETYTSYVVCKVPPAYTVSFDSANGDKVREVRVAEGTAVGKPADPVREGYEFKGWLLNGAPYDFSSPVASDMTLVADWEEKPEPIVPESPGTDEPAQPEQPGQPGANEPAQPGMPGGATDPGQPGDTTGGASGPGETEGSSSGDGSKEPGTEESGGAKRPSSSSGSAKRLADTGDGADATILASTGDRVLAVAGALVLAGAASAAVALASRRKAAARGRHAR